MPHTATSFPPRMSKTATRPKTTRVALISVHGGPLVETGAEAAGGQNVYVREVARALARLDFQVDVFTRGLAHERPEIRKMDGVRVIRLPAGPPGFIDRDNLFQHLPEFVNGMLEFGGTYDLVHSNYWLSGWVGMQYTRIRRIPQVHTHHSLGVVKYAAAGSLPPIGRVRLRTENALLAHCASIVATSHQDLESMEYYGHPPRVSIVPCGVDNAVFYPRDARECRAQLGLPLDRPIVSYAGRLHAQKGVDTAVKAVGPEVELVLAGEGDQLEPLQKLARQLGVKAHFLGKASHDRLPLVYGAADVCVMPSHYESFGMVALEAMACARPVVASDVGGLRYTILHGQTGLLAEARNERAFADCIRLLLQDKDLRREMSRAACAHVNRSFTWDGIGNSLAALYEKVLFR